jgi:hypothetical protein
MPFCSCSLSLSVPSTAIPIKQLFFHHSWSLLTAVLNSCSPHQCSSPALSTFLDSACPHQPLWFYPFQPSLSLSPVGSPHQPLSLFPCSSLISLTFPTSAFRCPHTESQSQHLTLPRCSSSSSHGVSVLPFTALWYSPGAITVLTLSLNLSIYCSLALPRCPLPL